VLERLVGSRSYRARGAIRRDDVARIAGVDYVTVGDLGGATDWSAALDGCDVVIHAAARAHVLRDTAMDPAAEYRRVNVEGTLRLADQAIAAGVRRFVFVSSIKVHGEETAPQRPFRPDDVPAPSDPYGQSKLDAEEGVRARIEPAGLEWVIVRPTLVYGPGVRANFLRMLQWLRRGIPLPLAAVQNRRSLIALDNLAALLERCAVHPAAANQIFLAADGEDLSTPELLRRLARAMGRHARLLPVPPAALLIAASLAGRRDVVRRLVGNLQVDVSKTCERLDWSPPITVDEGLEKTVRVFLATGS
jgi:UDP-glucose 4-epimerase